MRVLALLAAAALAVSAGAQEKAPAPRKKAAAKQMAHKKPTPQQVHKFEELEQKRDPMKKPARKREAK